MATRSTLFLKPKFGGVTPPSAGGAYAKSATVPALTSTIASPSTPATITSPGTGTATLRNIPAKTSSGGINISDVLKTAAVVGGGAALINAIKDGIKDTVKTPTTPVATKPATSVVTKPTTTTPTTPKVPPITIPTEPSSPTVPTAPVYQYPTDKNGETPYDDEGNLKPGWQLNENNDPVHVGISTPATPTTGGGGLNQTSTGGGGGNTPIYIPPAYKVDNSTSDEETTEEPTPEDVTDIDMDLAGNTTPVENVDPNYSDTGEEVQDWQEVNNDPQDYITGEQTLRENLPTGGLNQLTPKDATPEDAGPASPPSDTVEVPVARGLTPPATIENEEGPPLPALPPENEETNAVDENGFTSYAQDADGNTYGVGPDGQYYLVQEATPPEDTTATGDMPPEDVATTPDESGFVGYAQDDAGNTYGMDAEGNYYLVSEAVVDTSYDPNEYVDNTDQYVDNTDPYVDTTADYVEPDYSNYDTVDVRKGGLVAMKNGGGMPRYAGGDSVYSDTTEDMQPWQNVDAIDQNVDQTAMGDAPTTYQDPDYPDLNDSAGNTYVWNGTEYVGADKASMAAPEDQPLTDEDGNSYAKDDTGNYNLVSGPAYNAGQNPPKATATNTSNSPLTSVKNFLSNLDPATAAIGGALLAQLLKKSSIGGGGSHYTPNMADYAIKPHTTDFGIGPARVVASQGNDQPAYSPEQAAQLNTMLGVSGYDIQHEEPVPEAPAGGLAAASTAPTQTQEPAPEEQPMAMGGLADATHYGYGNPVDPLEMLGVRNAPQSASPTGQAIKKGGLPKPVGPLGVPMKAGRHDYRQGSYVEGPGDGQSDDIPAMLADGEYVIDAELVSMLGNGSNKAGAKVLDKFRQSVREHKRSAPSGKIPPKTKSPLAYLKGLQ